MKIDCGLCDKTFDDGLREITCPHNLLPYSTVAGSGIFDLPKVTQEPKFTARPGCWFDINPPSEEELARSIFEDGKADNSFLNRYMGDPDSFLPEPPVPKRIRGYINAVNIAMDRLTEANPDIWNMAGIPFKAHAFVPKDQVWLVDSMGSIVHKIINIGNALHDADVISICCGEMK